MAVMNIVSIDGRACMPPPPSAIETSEDGYAIWSQAIGMAWYHPSRSFVLQNPETGAMIDIDALGFCWLQEKQNA
jgi:hypothetical protein